MKNLRELFVLSVLSVAIQLAPNTASAQQQPSAQEGEFSVQRFEPAPGSKNYLSVEGARMEAAVAWSAGLMFNYARDPFVVASCVSDTDCSAPNAQRQEDVFVIRDLFTWDLLASVTPVPFLQIGLRFPLVFANGDGIDVTDGGQADDPLKAFAIGDPTLEGKVRFYGGARDPVVLGAAVDVSGPLGTATSKGNYIGNSAPVTVGVRGIFDGQQGPLGFGLNLRAKILPAKQRLGDTQIGPVEFRYGGGLSYQVSPVFRVLAEGYGATKFSTQNGTNSLEVDGAFQVQPLDSGFVFTLGGGAGILQGVGVPLFRGIAGIMYVREPGDEDGDGIDDKDDECPSVGEDFDDFEDDDGCPEDDNDQDGVPDARDKCPKAKETLNGLDDEDGCPDQVPDADKDTVPDVKDKCPNEPGKVRTKEWYGCPDTDQDGVPDPIDKCINEAEDTDGFQDTDGCPDPDNDGDGIIDERDECIDQPEIKNGYKDEDGCPDQTPDADADGIPDDRDKCPTKPENLNGVDDDDGCPDRGASLVQIEASEIKILQRVEFATNSDKIQGAKSFAVLDAVVGAMKNHPEIFLVEVAGHTDNAGSADNNRALSQKRAESVVTYLTDKGVERTRLQPKGYGPDKPIAENNTTAGKQKNRRVEFNILKQLKSQ